MKHISKLSQATALVAALGAACLTSLSAHAADAGTLTLKAKISMTTCKVVIGGDRDTRVQRTQILYRPGLQLVLCTSSNALNTRSTPSTAPDAMPAPAPLLAPATNNQCLFISDWVATSSDRFESGELRYDIQIPQAFLTRSSRQTVPKELLTRGDNAAFVNYNFNNFNSASVSANYLSLSSGINVGGWQFRQGSSVSQNELGQNQYRVGETILKRPLIDQKANLVIGDTSTDSPVVGGVPVRGVRVSSEEALYPESEREFRPVVRGVARTNARVRVLQNNAVILEQNVPPGPFELADLNPISSVGNFQVVVAEADGSEQRFVVPFSISIGKLNPGSYRYSVATGLYRNFTGTQNTQVVQAYVRYGLNTLVTPTIDFLAGPNYRNLGLQTSFNGALGGGEFQHLVFAFVQQRHPQKRPGVWRELCGPDLAQPEFVRRFKLPKRVLHHAHLGLGQLRRHHASHLRHLQAQQLRQLGPGAGPLWQPESGLGGANRLG